MKPPTPPTREHVAAGSKTRAVVRSRARARDAGHTLVVAADSEPHSRCHDGRACANELGELGRPGDPAALLPIAIGDGAAAAVAYAGGLRDAGHSALLDERGELWLCGCDRWQQLGLGASAGGASGYTWSRLWQERFQKNEHVVDLLRRLDPTLGSGSEGPTARRWIRDVSLGGDHTVVLSANQRDVVVFGKGGEKQLGLASTPWLSSPVKSKALSSPTADICAVCAFRHCSMTLDARGEMMNRAGKCHLSTEMTKALESCRKRARQHGLTT